MSLTRWTGRLISALLLAFAAVGCSGGNGGDKPTQVADPTTAPTRTTSEASPSPTAPTSIPDVQARLLQPGMRGLFGHDMVVYYHVDCYGCGGAEDNLWRAYLAADGRLKKEQLLPLHRIPPGGRVYASADDFRFGTAWIAICVVGYCGQEGDPSEDARNVALHSKDGGVSWQESGSLPAKAYMTGVVEGRLLLHRYVGGQHYEYTYFPDGERLTPPSGVPANAFARTNGFLHWQDREGKLYFSDGRPISLPLPPDAEFPAIVQDQKNAGLWVTWRANVPHIGLFHLDSGGRYLVDALWRWEGNTLWFGGMLTEVTGFGNAEYSEEACLLIGCEVDPTRRAPALEAVIIQTDSGTVHPIPELSEELVGNRHPFVIDMLRRQTARVANSGGCLNVRTTQAMGAETLGCFVDGVLLWHYGEEEMAEGRTWLRVSVPDGRTGWAATEFLEY